MNKLFYIAQTDSLVIIKIEKDRVFLISRRERYRHGSLFSINLKIFKKEERAIERQKAVGKKEESELIEKWKYLVNVIISLKDI